MATDPHRIFVRTGDLVCRNTTWLDVLKFFLLNYGLHALTVLTPPGSGAYIRLRNIFWSLLHPICGIAIALEAIFDSPIWEDDLLVRAQKAGALCMMMKKEGRKDNEWIDPNFFNIHGQHPMNLVPWTTMFKNWINVNSDLPLTKIDGEDFGLILVPRNVPIKPCLKLENSREKLTLDISCNYSAVNSLAAIAQIIYGSIELYEASGDQMDKYGYAAYSLTILPYIIMSFLNLIASICQPNYPYLYLVNPEVSGTTQSDDIRLRVTSGAVGEADPNAALPLPTELPLARSPSNNTLPKEPIMTRILRFPKEHFGGAVGLLAIVSVLVLPYLIIYLLTHFNPANSTIEQRGWIMTSIVIGHFSFLLIIVTEALMHTQISQKDKEEIDRGIWEGNWYGIPRLIPSERVHAIVIYLYLLVASVPAIGALAFVGNMIVDSQVCQKI